MKGLSKIKKKKNEWASSDYVDSFELNEIKKPFKGGCQHLAFQASVVGDPIRYILLTSF
jgi:hypothetical protein